MTTYSTVFCWNDAKLVVRQNVPTDDDAIANVVAQLQAELHTEEDDPRWQAVEGRLEVEVRQ